MERRGSLARIKLDLTADEIVVEPTIMREVHHPYSDRPKNGIHVNCYSFPEIFAEKIRALAERARPRDLYDVIHLYRHAVPNQKPDLILEVLEKKCQFKSIQIPDMKILETHSRLHELESEWENMLAHQLPMLPPREQFWQELPQMFAWLHGESRRESKPHAPLPAQVNINRSWSPPGMIRAWGMSVPFELVRYAGANHLCIELTYDNNKRLIEPYDLKQTQEGNLLLIAVRHDNGEWRSYRVDRIQKIEISNVSFNPRGEILLTPFVNF